MDTSHSPLQADLIAMLHAMRAAERDLFAAVPPGTRDTAGTIGDWSPKDVLAHLAAWRAIEARRLEARAAEDGARPADDPAPNEPIDESNVRLHARSRDLAWETVVAEADASVSALIGAVERSTTDVLCECDDGSVAGIGANGVNHAVGLRAGHVPPRDSGVILYNIACARALSGELDDARRLLAAAFSRRHDLAELARDDPDLVALRDELATIGSRQAIS